MIIKALARLLILTLTFASFAWILSGSAGIMEIEMTEPSLWKLTWSDEFTGPPGTPPDEGKWVHDIGGGGWGNKELEYYTDSPENAALDGNGQLAITARLAPEGLYCHYGPCRYTSARLKTLGKFEQQYGRVEARIKLPAGQGLWPAFWMLGNNFPSVSWPACGEIDIMEYRGSNTTASSSAIHGPGYYGNTPFYHRYSLPTGNFTDDFHLFAVEWGPDQLQFFVDQDLHYTVTRTSIEQRGAWVFDHPFFIIINLAVGGHFDGNPASDDIFPAVMLVDYVRVYEYTGAYQPLPSK